ncbi:MAG: hypothetical protein ABI310_07140 [Microbacteriaceae bacterium]
MLGGPFPHIVLGQPMGRRVRPVACALDVESIGIGYRVFAAGVLIAAFGFVLFNRDFPSRDTQLAPFSW